MTRPGESGEEQIDEAGRNATQRAIDADPDADREVDTEWEEGAGTESDAVEEDLPPAV